MMRRSCLCATLLFCAFGLTDHAKSAGTRDRIRRLQQRVDALSKKLSSLRKNLGGWQYANLDPEISYTVKRQDFQKPNNDYGTPKVAYTVHAQQQNASFPLDTYRVHVVLSVVNQKGKRQTQFKFIAEMEDGVGSYANVQSLYDLGATLRTNALDLTVDYYTWFPKRRFSPVGPGRNANALRGPKPTRQDPIPGHATRPSKMRKHQNHSPNPKKWAGAGPSEIVTDKDGMMIAHITANDQMHYNVSDFTLPAGQKVKIILYHVGRIPRSAMGHNLVILQQDEKPASFASRVATTGGDLDNGYLPSTLRDKVIARTKLLGGGKRTSITFTTPKPGDYPYLCTFPAHAASGMKGTMHCVKDD